MFRFFYPFFVFVMFCCYVSAVECPGDKKPVLLGEKQINYSMYNDAKYANKLEKCDRFDSTCDLYKGGEWEVQNIVSKDVNVVGRALCLDSVAFEDNDDKIGPCCYCTIQGLDNYMVFSDWVNVKQYQNNVFDENKQYTSESAKEYEQKRINDMNIQECMKDCSKTCQSMLSQLIKFVRGYYVCDKALYKTKKDVICTVGNQLIKIKNILVFDDIAEIKTKNKSIIFTRDTKDSKNFIYTGEYDYDPIYLKMKDNKIYVGNAIYSMAECL